MMPAMKPMMMVQMKPMATYPQLPLR
jgi:hypothetical protein